MLNLNLPDNVKLSTRRKTVQFIRDLNQATVDVADEEFQARIDAYELAFRMQTEAPEILSLAKETQETRDLYGIGTEPTDDYGRRCLMARKLVENGVRFVCVVSGRIDDQIGPRVLGLVQHPMECDAVAGLGRTDRHARASYRYSRSLREPIAFRRAGHLARWLARSMR